MCLCSMWSARFLPFIERQTEGHNGRVVLCLARYVRYL